ncbi:MAG: glycosyltransferase [Acidobacteriota bacterium]
MPVYQDWESAALVCRAIDEHLASLSGVSVRVLLVDDGSPEDVQDWDLVATHSLTRIDVLRLHRNVGHQRAICAGICYVHDHIGSDAVLIMDADGEDRPEDAVHLIERAISNRNAVLFAGRRKRLEGIVFRIGYSFFRRLHRLLTGVPVRVGNFSILPSSVLSRLTSMPEMWNHYAGAVFKSKCRFEIIPMDRGRRVRGRSHMNITSLVTHGLSGIASFQETVATRILIANTVCLFLLLLALGLVVGVRLFTSMAVPGWATYTVGIIAILFTQVLAVSFSLVFSLISNRSSTAFIPSRDCAFFIDRLHPLVSQDGDC